METKNALDSLYNQITDDESMASHPPMKTEPKHTPLKTYKTTVVGLGPFCIEFPDGEIITIRSEQRQSEIVHAVNSHAALSTALDACVEALEIFAHLQCRGTQPNEHGDTCGITFTCINCLVVRDARAALDVAKKARGA